MIRRRCGAGYSGLTSDFVQVSVLGVLVAHMVKTSLGMTVRDTGTSHARDVRSTVPVPPPRCNVIPHPLLQIQAA